MIRKPISNKMYWAFAALSVAILILAYSYMSHRQKLRNPKDTTIPNATQFVEGVKQMTKVNAAGESWLWEDLKATYTRHFLGMLCGVVLSLVVGMLMGCFPKCAAFFELPLSWLAKVPPTAMIAVYFVLFGTELKMFVAMIALGIFPTLAWAIYQAAKKDVSDHAVYKAYTLGASNSEVIYNVVFMQVLPRIIENVRLMLGPAMVFLIAAEWMMADVGFGYRLRIQSRLLNMNVVYTYLILLGVVGYFMDWSLSKLRKKLCPWFGE